MRHQEPTKPNTYLFVASLLVWLAYTIMACYQGEFFTTLASAGVLILTIFLRLMHVDYYKLAQEAKLKRKQNKSLKQQLNETNIQLKESRKHIDDFIDLRNDN